MLESYIERRILKPAIEALGGLCWKLTAVGITGIPDRLILLPGGRIYFVETKTKGGKLSARQRIVHTQLRKLGFEVWEIWSREDVDKFIKYLEDTEF